MSASQARVFDPVLWRFVLVGCANTLIGLGVILSAKAWLGWADLPANVLGYGIGLVVSFLLNSRFTFGYRGDQWRALRRFAGVFLCAWSANWISVMLLIDALSVNAYLAHVLAVLPYTIAFYLGSRWYAFRAQ